MAFPGKGKGARKSPIGSPNAGSDTAKAKGGKKGKRSGGKSGKKSKKGQDSCNACGEQSHSCRCPKKGLSGDAYAQNTFCTESQVQPYSEDSADASHLKDHEVEPMLAPPPIRSAPSTPSQSVGGLRSKASSKAASIRSPTSSLEPPSCLASRVASPGTPASAVLLTKAMSKAISLVTAPPSPPIDDADLPSPKIPDGSQAPEAEPLKRTPSPSFIFSLPPPSKKMRCENDDDDNLLPLLSELPCPEHDTVESSFDLPAPVKASVTDQEEAALVLPKVGFLLPSTEAETLTTKTQRNAIKLGGDEEDFKESADIPLASLLPPPRTTGGLFATIPPPLKRVLGDSEEKEEEALSTKKRPMVDVPNAEESDEEDKAQALDEDLVAEDVATNNAASFDESKKILEDDELEPPSGTVGQQSAENEKLETAVDSIAQNVSIAEKDLELERKVKARETELREEELLTSLTAQVAEAIKAQSLENHPSPSEDLEGSDGDDRARLADGQLMVEDAWSNSASFDENQKTLVDKVMQESPSAADEKSTENEKKETTEDDLDLDRMVEARERELQKEELFTSLTAQVAQAMRDQSLESPRPVDVADVELKSLSADAEDNASLSDKVEVEIMDKKEEAHSEPLAEIKAPIASDGMLSPVSVSAPVSDEMDSEPDDPVDEAQEEKNTPTDEDMDIVKKPATVAKSRPATPHLNKSTRVPTFTRSEAAFTAGSTSSKDSCEENHKNRTEQEPCIDPFLQVAEKCEAQEREQKEAEQKAVTTADALLASLPVSFVEKDPYLSPSEEDEEIDKKELENDASEQTEVREVLKDIANEKNGEVDTNELELDDDDEEKSLVDIAEPDAEMHRLSDGTEEKASRADILVFEIMDKKEEEDVNSDLQAETTKTLIASDDTPAYASMVAEVSFDEITRELDDLLDRAQEGKDAPTNDNMDIVKNPATVAKARPAAPLPYKRPNAPAFARSERTCSAGSTSSKDSCTVKHKNHTEEEPFIDPFLKIAEEREAKEREQEEAEEKAAAMAAKAAAVAEELLAAASTSFVEEDPYLSPNPSEADEDIGELELDNDASQQTEVKKVLREVGNEADANELELDSDDEEEVLGDVAKLDAGLNRLRDGAEGKASLADILGIGIMDKKEDDVNSDPREETKALIASDDTTTCASMVAEVSFDEIRRELDDLLDKAQEAKDAPIDDDMDIVKKPAAVAKTHPAIPLPYTQPSEATFARSEPTWSPGSASSKDPCKVNHKNRIKKEPFIDPFLQITNEREAGESKQKKTEEKTAAMAAEAAAIAEAILGTAPTSLLEKDPYLSPYPSEADEEMDELELDNDLTQQTEVKEVQREVVNEGNREMDANELELDNDDEEESPVDVAEDDPTPELELREDAYRNEVVDDIELDEEMELEMEEDIDELELDSEAEAAQPHDDGEDDMEFDM